MLKLPIKRWLGAIDYTVSHSSPRKLFWGSVIINLALIAIVVFASVLSNEARFTINAVSEIVRIELPKGQSSFAWGKVKVDPTSLPKDRRNTCADPIIDLSDRLIGPVVAEIRIDLKAGLTATLKSQNAADPKEKRRLGEATCANGETVELFNYVKLSWPDAATSGAPLSFDGYTAIGDFVPDGKETALVLREGTITVEAQSAPFKGGQVTRESKLFLGDQVQLFEADDVPAVAHGLIRIDKDGAMKIVAHADARSAHVAHVGQDSDATTSIAPAFWDKVQAQSQWTMLLILGALLLNAISAMRHYRSETMGEPAEDAGATR